MSIVGLIPARGGSKGIPGKNIAFCAGKPLLAYTAEAALSSSKLDKVILSTDDSSIADIGISLGIEVPFRRPETIAGDQATSLSVMVHALDWLEENGHHVNAIALLQPTSPLRQTFHIDDAIAHFQSCKAETLVSVVEVPHRFHPRSLMHIDGGRLLPHQHSVEKILRRQDLPKLYARNGPAILILSAKQIRSGILYGENTIPYVMSAEDSLDIDTPEDLLLAEMVIAHRNRRLT